MNFINNMMDVTAPIITGTQSFVNAFIVAGVVLLVGIFSYIFVLGKIVPISASPRQK